MGADGVYLDVILDRSISARALVDSGCASLATVSLRTAKQCRAQRLPIEPRLIRQVIGEEDPPTCTEIAVFDLDLGEYSERLYAYVLPEQIEPLILGERWMLNHDASLRPAKKQVHLRLPRPLTLTTIPANAAMTQISSKAVSLYRDRALRQKSSGIRIFSATLKDIEKALKPKNHIDPVTVCPDWLLPVIDAFDRKKAAQLPVHQPGFDTEIRLLPGKTPTLSPLYSMSKEELLVLRKTLYELLDAGFIRASNSEAAAPVIFVKKPGGGLRFCVDYRALNSITEKDGYPPPLIHDTLRSIAQAKYVSKVDVISAFHRLRVKEGDEWLTAFRTHFGSFEYLVTPFGLSGAPAAFQRFINHILRRWIGVSVTAYLDDVVIYTDHGQRHHQQTVREVVQALGAAGLQLDWEKSDFESTAIKYLGFIVRPGVGIEADPEKIRAIQEWEPPTSVRGIRGFLGFCNFYRTFVPKYSELTAPLTLMTRKDHPFTWSESQNRAFESLKHALIHASALATFDPEHPTVVETDASGWALGGNLRQLGPDGIWKPIAFYSRKLTPAEVNYPIHDKEMLAIFSCLRHWRPYLAGISFEVHTDHRNLVYFRQKQTLVERQRRWSYELSEFDFSLVHKPGTTQIVSDALSRRDQDLPQDITDQRLQSRVHQVLRPNGDKLIIAAALWAQNPDQDSNTDPPPQPDTTLPSPFASADLDSLWSEALLKNTRYWIARSAVLNQERSFPKEWGIPWQISECTLDTKSRLMWRDRLWIPHSEHLRTRLIQQTHDSSLTGHPGRTLTRDLVARRYAWPGLTEDVRRFVRNCGLCGQGKVWREQKRGLLKPLPVPERPWQELAMDFVGELPPSHGHSFILGVTDRLTKSAILIPMAKVTAPDVAQALLTHVFAHHGLPRAIVSDRGPQFTSMFWNEICRQLGIKQRLSTAFHPETDGTQERGNQEIETYLRFFTTYEQDDWSQLLPQAQMALNNRTSATTGFSPFFFTHGFHLDPIEPSDDITGSTHSPATAAQQWLAKQKEISVIAQAAMAASQETQERHANKHRQAAELFKVGDRVFLRLKNLTTQRPSKKLDWLALPYTVVQLIGSHAVKLNTAPGIHPVFHVNLVRHAGTDPLPSQIMHNPEPPPIAPEKADADHMENEYVVRAIRNHRWFRRRHEVLVEWEGYAEPTWEPLRHLEDTEALENYEQTHNCPWKREEEANVMVHGPIPAQPCIRSSTRIRTPSLRLRQHSQ